MFTQDPTSNPQEGAPADLVIGVARVLFAYDVASSIDLDQAEKSLSVSSPGEDGARAAIGVTRRAPAYLAKREAPLRFFRAVEPVIVGGFESSRRTELTLYEFGAISVALEIPFRTPLAALLELGDALYDNAELDRLSRAWTREALARIGRAARNPGVSEASEDFVIYVVSPSQTGHASELVRAQGALVAQLLRGERAELSEGEVGAVMEAVMSFRPDDATVIDWNAALVMDSDPADTLRVLEFANVELLEMRHLDDRLDDDLDEAFDALTHSGWRDWLPLGSPLRSRVERLAELRTDGARMFEGVHNALKLIGDQFLARLYRLASERLGTPGWDASITRKLEALESVHQKLADRHMHRRMEVLEWIIIVLIALSMVQALVLK